MIAIMTFHRWKLPASPLRDDLTPQAARDLIIECFYQAQCETFARAKEKLTGTSQAPGDVRTSVIGAVRLAFKECGGDFDRPTKRSLGQTVEVLGRKAQSWGTPGDIIEHHAAQIRLLLEQVVD
jgi:hypothetical protein